MTSGDSEHGSLRLFPPTANSQAPLKSESSLAPHLDPVPSTSVRWAAASTSEQREVHIQAAVAQTLLITFTSLSRCSNRYAPTAGVRELREAVANLYNTTYRQGKASKYTHENVCIVPGGRAGLIRVSIAGARLMHIEKRCRHTEEPRLAAEHSVNSFATTAGCCCHRRCLLCLSDPRYVLYYP